MSPLPLPAQTLARLNHAADSGLSNAIAILHLLNRADKRDQDVAEFVDSYTHTIAALCRRLESLERASSDRPIADTPAEDASMVNDIRTAMTSDDIPSGPLSEDDLRQRWNQQADQYNQWESLDSYEQLAWAQALAIRADRHAAALKAEPERAAEALAARPLLERVARLGDVIGQQTVAQVQQLANQAAAWLRENPPGQPVAIEPRGCPIPGACSCVEPTPPAPELGDAPRPTFLDAIRLAQGCHDYSGGRTGAEGDAWHGAIDAVVGVLKRAAVGPWDSQTRAVFGVGAEAQAGDVGMTERRSEGDWVDDLQHAIESKEDDFLGGVCVALALVTAHGEATIWREIVRSVGTDSLLNYAANVNPDDWNLTGFGKYAQSELGKGKPLPAPQAEDVEA